MLGFLSDALPLWDYRRKSYLLVGNVMAVVSLLGFAVDVTTGAHSSGNVFSIGLYVFAFQSGLILADVMSDTYCVELSHRHEGPEDKGRIQGIAYSYRFAGGVLGSCGGTFLYNKANWGWGLPLPVISIVCVLLLMTLFPLISMLDEESVSLKTARGDAPPQVAAQCRQLWQICKKRAVWQPMLYIYFFNVMQIPNPAWNNFLLKGLGFTSFQLGLISCVGSLMSLLGLELYKRYMMHCSWRNVYIGTTVLNGVISLAQVMLTQRWNLQLGMPDFLFSFGDSVMASFILGVQYLPCCIMMIAMCPEGSEGASYEMFTTLSNVALSASSAFGNMLAPVWDVSNLALERQHFGGMTKLTLLTTVLQTVPIFFVGFLPAGSKDQEAWAKEQGESTCLAGLLLFLLFGALAWTMVQSLAAVAT